LYALSWTYAQDGKLALDASTGIVTDANPAAESLMGYSREELIGKHVTMLYPEAERERVKIEFRRAVEHASTQCGQRIAQRQDPMGEVHGAWLSQPADLHQRHLLPLRRARYEPRTHY